MSKWKEGDLVTMRASSWTPEMLSSGYWRGTVFRVVHVSDRLIKTVRLRDDNIANFERPESLERAPEVVGTPFDAECSSYLDDKGNVVMETDDDDVAAALEAAQGGQWVHE